MFAYLAKNLDAAVTASTDLNTSSEPILLVLSDILLKVKNTKQKKVKSDLY